MKQLQRWKMGTVIHNGKIYATGTHILYESPVAPFFIINVHLFVTKSI